MALPFGFPKMTWNCLSSNPLGAVLGCIGAYNLWLLICQWLFFFLQHKKTFKWYTLPTTGWALKINGSIMTIIFGKAYFHCYVGFREGIHRFSLYYQTFQATWRRPQVHKAILSMFNVQNLTEWAFLDKKKVSLTKMAQRLKRWNLSVAHDIQHLQYGQNDGHTRGPVMWHHSLR